MVHILIDLSWRHYFYLYSSMEYTDIRSSEKMTNENENLNV